ncbi:uncharacterized protein EI97DRAFT_479189 [Westerdykella ornata]|uniref:TMEM205-like domain-containing protein n=1 Tax=Westerdykella ornata TaxID=318751 RepID=A0A6A6JCU1_WESOR|nr:uncharacterized protein EI97DRAFT_479189 [Westerdykella ornata]KAF2274044.1 hypothetical protein EI97DRAFT_479189 [Westerdykella ornata]
MSYSVNRKAGVAQIHLLLYSTLLGTELYQSFVITKVCYQVLPRSAFTTLQKRIFPLYFQGQTLLLVLTAATVPPYGPLSLLESKSDWIPFVVAGISAIINLTVFGPRTRQGMIDRIHQETRDGKMYGATDTTTESSDEMRLVSRAFSRNHAVSIHLNLITIGATLWYGWRLASRF